MTFKNQIDEVYGYFSLFCKVVFEKNDISELMTGRGEKYCAKNNDGLSSMI